MFKRKTILIGSLLLFAGSLFVLAGQCQQLSCDKIRSVVTESWHAYKSNFIQGDGRVIDKESNQITTSEGQSYALLRAAWSNDQDEFNTVWRWTQANLENKATGLFAWKWGQNGNGQWTVLDSNSASDADEDIALALLVGGHKWNRVDLLDRAKQIVSSLWAANVVDVNGKSYLLPGQWAKSNGQAKLNPSYMAPYAYRIFAKVDPGHPWLRLVESSYDVIEQSSALSRLGLPPDWCYLGADGHVSIKADAPESDYSYDALRVPWRIAIDYQWNNEPRARKFMDQLRFLADSWKAVRTIRVGYTARGVMREFDEPIAGFAAILPVLQITDPQVAQQILQERVMSVYYDGVWRPDKNKYYDNNWAWLGLAAFCHSLQPPTP